MFLAAFSDGSTISWPNSMWLPRLSQLQRMSVAQSAHALLSSEPNNTLEVVSWASSCTVAGYLRENDSTTFVNGQFHDQRNIVRKSEPIELFKRPAHRAEHAGR